MLIEFEGWGHYYPLPHLKLNERKEIHAFLSQATA